MKIEYRQFTHGLAVCRIGLDECVEYRISRPNCRPQYLLEFPLHISPGSSVTVGSDDYGTVIYGAHNRSVAAIRECCASEAEWDTLTENLAQEFEQCQISPVGGMEPAIFMPIRAEVATTMFQINGGFEVVYSTFRSADERFPTTTNFRMDGLEYFKVPASGRTHVGHHEFDAYQAR